MSAKAKVALTTPKDPSAQKASAETKSPSLLSTVKDDAGGIVRVPSLDEILDEVNRNDEWKGREGHYYFSGLFRCFRKAWYQAKGRKCDHEADGISCEQAIRDDLRCQVFDAGKAQPGNATEERVRKLYAEVLNYGHIDGPILNDVRFSIPIPVEWQFEEESQKKPGKYIVRTRSATIHLVGKTDTVIIGDNLRVLQFSEIKSPVFQFPTKASKLVRSLGSKRVPLSIAGITEPEDPDGIVSLPQVAQLAVGCKVLEDRGQAPELAVLQTIDRGNYRLHIEVFITPEEWRFLYDLAVWWVKEHHVNLQFDEPPAPQFFMGYDCKYCPFAGACAKENARTGDERVMHPIMPGISKRLAALSNAPDAAKALKPKGKAKKGGR